MCTTLKPELLLLWLLVKLHETDSEEYIFNFKIQFPLVFITLQPRYRATTIDFYLKYFYFFISIAINVYFCYVGSILPPEGTLGIMQMLLRFASLCLYVQTLSSFFRVCLASRSLVCLILLAVNLSAT